MPPCHTTCKWFPTGSKEVTSFRSDSTGAVRNIIVWTQLHNTNLLLGDICLGQRPQREKGGVGWGGAEGGKKEGDS